MRKTQADPHAQAGRATTLAGLTALYRPATMAERVLDEFAAGVSVEELKLLYPGCNVDTIIRAHVTPGGSDAN